MKKLRVFRRLSIVVLSLLFFSCSTEDHPEINSEAQFEQNLLNTEGREKYDIILHIEWAPGVSAADKASLRDEYFAGKGKIHLRSFVLCLWDQNIETWVANELICPHCKDDPKAQAQGEDDVDRASYFNLCFPQ